MMMIPLRTVYLLLTLTVISCSQKCPDEKDLGTITLSEASKKLSPYQNNEKKLVFKDSLGNELTFDIVPGVQNGSVQTTWRKDCQDDRQNSKEISIIAKIERNIVNLKPSIPESRFNYHLQLEVKVNASDLDNIKERDVLSIYRSNVANFSHITDGKNSSIENDPSEAVPEITINGKQFKNVLRSSFMNKGDLYYSLQEGLVAFNEHFGRSTADHYWVLDRVLYD